ncbi:hypothetical protein C9374_005254 [Naegleria lovaniensis]|uniref:Uncharacterized protein n=1 Tax=Naegleria lovaniensis TaxID=51637 RepID=A0AA88GP69_NAELO|nr:uncharacterized protein C9374_005254 [Naegleria lovaniensis]KAG2382674.1 hypothetical protein C9374_005254 [Naegleria lovaniensis]
MPTTAFICRSLFDRIFFSWVYDDLVQPLRTIVDSKLQKNNAKQPSPSTDSSKFNPSLNPLFSLGDPSEEKKRKCKKQFEYIQQETADRYDHIDNTRDDEFINNNFKEMSLTKAAIILHKLFGWEFTNFIDILEFLLYVLNFIVKIASSASFHYLDFMRFKDRKHNVECMREEFLKAISKISFIQKQKTNFGKVSTILDSDISTVANAKYDLQDFHAHIAYVILNFVTMANIIGVKASCSGVAFLALSTPIYHHFMKKREAKQKEEIGLTENKSSFITQFLLSIKLIKVYTLEIFFNNKIKDIQDSIGKIRTIEIGYNFLINSIHYTQTALFSSITFFVFCYMDGNSLKLSSALCVIELVDSLKWPLYNLSSDIQALFSKRLSIVRIGQILNSPKYSFHTNYLDENSNTIIEMKNVHATWSFSQRVVDEKRLEMVLCASDLKNDVAQMKNGVLQVIGQRGINLSGGQKTRLALARALYHNSDLYLFDDIFSALDIHTTYRILNALFTGEEPMLKNKTVILSSHQLQFLQHMDSVIVMDKGQIVEQDHFDHLCKKLNNLLPNQSTPFSDLISSTATINDVYENGFVKNNPNEPNTTTSQNKENNGIMDAIANTAKKQPKPVNSKLMLVIEFLFSLGSLKSGSFIFAILCLGALEYTMVVSSDVFLSEWTSDENFHNHSLAFYTSIYNIHGILIMIAKCVNKILIGNFLYILAGICQETLLKKLAEAKLSLYEDMPSGHILQYFRYIDEIRNDISWKFYDLISTAWDGLIGIVMVLYAFPQSAFLLVILIPITNYYRNIHTSVSEYIRDLQQETHDPTMTIANEILDGLDTIRAFGHDKFDFLIEEIREKKKPKTSLEYCLELLWMWFFWRNTFFREFAKSLCLLGAFFVSTMQQQTILL